MISRIVVNSDDESLQCKDESGNIVDWYVMYKIPKVSESSDPVIRKGTKYLFITNKTVHNGWQLSNKEISFKDSLPGKTLEALYNDDVASKAMWIMYNDQAPKKYANSRFGHAKGIVMTDDNRGFWLVHSVPKYPPSPISGTEKPHKEIKSSSEVDDTDEDNDEIVDSSDNKYDYPKTGMTYGQSFLCISFDANQMNIIGLQLMYNQVIPYRYNMPKVLSRKFPSLVNASKRAKIKRPPYNRKSELQSIGGRQFISFAKTDKWQKDLYDDFVAPKLQTDLLAETWLNGPGKLPSECTGAKVLNVQSITLDAANVDFKSSRDHSKWAVATSNKNNNNWDTQFSRGGGTVCINLLQLWSNYRESVNEIEPCPKKSGIIQLIANWIFSVIN
ncbi:hypothetical protein PV326_007514 [Microctonus aethiopoides]|nr:hypothetical protein PV326_007514 [Microctonus aethiopoides]